MMNTCPECKAEYDGILENCPECSKKGETVAKAGKMEDWVHLTTVSNEIEFGMVASLLEMGSIPAVKKVHGLDGYFEIILGTPLGGIDVLVPADKYEEALGLLNTPVDEEEFTV